MIHVNRLPTLVRQHIAAFRALLVFTVLCGIIYPVVMVGVAQLAFKNQADGSLVTYNGKVVGSSLLCQEFVDAKGNPLPQYFQPRPSTASNPNSKTDYGCDPNYSGAANLGPNNTTLLKNIQQLQQQIAAFDHVKVSQIPPDAVTDFGVRTRPGHLAAVRGHPGQPGRRGAAPASVGSPGAGQQVHPGPEHRLPRRAAGECAEPEHRPRRVARPGPVCPGRSLSPR